MEAKELRVGNVLLFQGSKGKLFGINNYGFIQYSEENTIFNCSIDEIEPIKLTEEILLKCGFEKTTYITRGIEIEIVCYRLNNIVVYILNDFFEIEIITADGQFNLYKSFKKHLHQLQNLYFALTNEELNIEL